MGVKWRFVLMLPAVLALGGCLNIFGASTDDVPPSQRQLPASTQALLAIKGMKPEAPIFIRIFKEEAELEVWKYKDGRFQHFKTYPICAFSGTLGPKVQVGDKQAPEGFYTVGPHQLNPNSLYHLAFNLGYPNPYDRANNHTGSALMVHGKCKSVGCYAMTDAYIEEIYILAREAFAGGQKYFHAHAFPFRMTDAKMREHSASPWYPFWTKMKEGYDAFEASGKPPIIKVCAKQYLVNVQFHGPEPAPDAACPAYAKIDPDKLPGIEGVPQTVLASLSGKAAAPAQAQQATQPAAVVTAALAGPAQGEARQSQSQSTPAATDMSASPVFTRQSHPPAAGVALAAAKWQQPPKAAVTAQAHRENATAALAANLNRAPVTQSQNGGAQQSSTPPTSGQVQAEPPQQSVQIAAAPTASQPTSEEDAPTKAVDPEALQKPNRSAKGGKLAQSQPSAGALEPQGGQPVNLQSGLGFNGQDR